MNTAISGVIRRRDRKAGKRRVLWYLDQARQFISKAERSLVSDASSHEVCQELSKWVNNLYEHVSNLPEDVRFIGQPKAHRGWEIGDTARIKPKYLARYAELMDTVTDIVEVAQVREGVVRAVKLSGGGVCFVAPTHITGP